MGHGVVHTAYSAVALDVQRLEEFHYRMNVPLSIGVRLHQVNEQQVLAALLTDVVEVGVGHDDNALTINKFGRGTIPREVEEVAGPVQLSELLGFQVTLQPLQGQRPYAACIDPG